MKQLNRVLMGAGVIMLFSAPAFSAEKPHPAYPHYWMSVATMNQSMPGMTPEMAGMAGMFGGRGAAFGPRRDLQLQVEGPRDIAEPRADHLIPPGQKMGESLPLTTPRQEKAERPQRMERPEQYEKPKARMLIYWGCGELAAKGQPKIIDTEKMSPTEFGRAFVGRGPTYQAPPAPRKGWTYGDWPNADDRKEIPGDASLVGNHLVKGNYLPDIRFSLDQKRDFMAPVEFVSLSKSGAGAWPFTWKAIPTATGYFATAMGHNQKTGETIFWSSSELPETGMALMGYLSNQDVQRFIREQVVMPASRTSCAVPAEVFRDVDGAMLQFIAYGEELNIVYPPRPKDPKLLWNPQWSVKVRLKSTGTSPLMEAREDGRRKSSRQRSESVEQQPQDDDAEDRKPSRRKNKGGALDGMRGLFGF